MATFDRNAPHAGIYGPGGQIGWAQNGQTFDLQGNPKEFIDQPAPDEPDAEERRVVGQFLDEQMVDLPDGPFVLVGKCRRWIVEYLALEARGRSVELHAFAASFAHLGDDLARLRNIVYHEGDRLQIPGTLENVALAVLDLESDEAMRHWSRVLQRRCNAHGRVVSIVPPKTAAAPAPKAPAPPAGEQIPVAEATWDDLRAIATKRKIKAASKAFILAELAKAGVTHFNPAEL